LRGAIASVTAKDPPSEADDAQRRHKEGDAHEEPRRDPLAREEHQACAGAGAVVSASSSPDSRRSRSGMKLRTGGTRSKLYGGGGEEVAHSRVLAAHGSSPATSPPLQLRTTLTRNSSTEKA